jgi:hypothetical protein
MYKERDRPPAGWTLDAVSLKAQEMALENGGHVPTLLVEGTRQSAVLQFAELGETHEERVEHMLLAGVELAQEASVGELEQIFFVVEGNISIPKHEQKSVAATSQEPIPQSVLIVTQLNLRELLSRGMIYQMIRDDREQLTQLRPYPAEQNSYRRMESPLLSAFVQGFVTSAMQGE